MGVKFSCSPFEYLKDLVSAMFLNLLPSSFFIFSVSRQKWKAKQVVKRCKRSPCNEKVHVERGCKTSLMNTETSF